MKLQTTEYGDDRDRKLITTYLDQLSTLGILTGDDYQAVDDHLIAADQAETVLAEFDHLRVRAVSDAAMKLADDITVEKVSAAAVKLADVQDVHDVLLEIWRNRIGAAKEIVLSAFTHIPAVLTERLEDNAARGLAAATALDGVYTAERAIAAGVVDEWRALQDAEAEFSAISGLVSDLRWGTSERGNSPLIPARGRHDRDDDRWAWEYRHRPEQVVTPGIRRNGYSDIERRAMQVAKWNAAPYVPASKAEVESILIAEVNVSTVELVSA